MNDNVRTMRSKGLGIKTALKCNIFQIHVDRSQKDSSELVLGWVVGQPREHDGDGRR